MELLTLPAPLSWTDIFFSLLCGMIIGLERQLRGKPAGMRTSALVCLGTCVFVKLGVSLDDVASMTGTVDRSRVLGQVIVGVGFLGGGLMMVRDGGRVKGITSATVIWLLAGVGSLIGFGHHTSAVVISLCTVAILTGTTVLEKMFLSLQAGVHRLKQDSVSPPDSD
ncbi:MAG: MgtC/SapB family protein [Bdellovibrionales bacterium]|nr:MgtC/SapB family protein [Bdellovibrionales bacterium]